MRLYMIACKVFYREICYCVAQSPNEVDIHFLPQGLHDYGKKGMQEAIGKAIASVDQERYQAILLAYGLCNNGVTELQAPDIPLVIPRAHDCLTLFMGDKQKYKEYFFAHPGTYYLTSGWIERTNDLEEIKKLGLETKNPMGGGLEDLIKKYGEKKARYLYDIMHSQTHYQQITYIEMGIEPGDQFERHAQEEAEKKKYKFEKLSGDLKLIKGLVDGSWDEADFLVVPPGQKIKPALDSELIIKSE